MSDAVQVAPWIAGQARQILKQPGHAWLLQGPSGLGQYELALFLARAWLCEQASEQGACGQCASCHAIDVRTHADLAVLMPETVMSERGWPLGEKAQDDIDSKKRKPSREIRVEAMRDTVARMSGFSAKSSRGGVPVPSFFILWLLAEATRQSATAAAKTAASAGSAASTAASISRAVSTATTRTPAGGGTVAGPVTKVTVAPCPANARAIAVPCAPDDRLAM